MNNKEKWEEKIDLKKDEALIFEQLQQDVVRLRDISLKYFTECKEEYNTLFPEAAKKAFQLRTKLNERGIQIQFPQESLRNRRRSIGKDPDCLEFYNHFHILEDIVHYIQWPAVHENVEDITIGISFSYKIDSHERGIEQGIPLSLKRNTTGWDSKYDDITIFDDDKGCSCLLAVMENSTGKVRAPRNIERDFEILWDMAAEGELSPVELTIELRKLFDWISGVEKYRPNAK